MNILVRGGTGILSAKLVRHRPGKSQGASGAGPWLPA